MKSFLVTMGKWVLMIVLCAIAFLLGCWINGCSVEEDPSKPTFMKAEAPAKSSLDELLAGTVQFDEATCAFRLDGMEFRHVPCRMYMGKNGEIYALIFFHGFGRLPSIMINNKNGNPAWRSPEWPGKVAVPTNKEKA